MRDIIPDGYEPFADNLKEMNILAHTFEKKKWVVATLISI